MERCRSDNPSLNMVFETVYNEKKHWMWNVSTEEDTLVLMRPTRSSVVLEEVFGEFLDGILNSDCFKGYDRFKAREYQKDWAHVLRDARAFGTALLHLCRASRGTSRMYRYIQKVKNEGREDSPVPDFCSKLGSNTAAVRYIASSIPLGVTGTSKQFSLIAASLANCIVPT